VTNLQFGVTSCTQAGVDLTAAAGIYAQVPQAATNYFVNDGTCFLVIVTGASPEVLTITGQALTYNGSAVNQTGTSIAANHVGVMGPFPRMYFNDASGYCYFAASETSTTKVSVVSFVPKG
jgi:hypothetical protein